MCFIRVSEVTQSHPALCSPWTVASRVLRLWDFPGKSTGVGCHFVLQGIYQGRENSFRPSQCLNYLELCFSVVLKELLNLKSSTLLKTLLGALYFCAFAMYSPKF